MTHIFTLPQGPAAAIAGTGQIFPVGRIFCIGRNDEAHAREMGSDPSREAPFAIEGLAPLRVTIGEKEADFA